MDLHAGFGFQTGGRFGELRVRRLNDFLMQGRERLRRQRDWTACGERLRREA